MDVAMDPASYSCGCTLLDAIKDKYASEEPLQFNILVPKSAPGKKDSGEIILPSQLAINGCNVSMAGDEENLRRMCENVTELDLTDNRITDWHEVFKLLHSMPNVHFLNLANNPLNHETLSKFINNALTFPFLTRIILNGTFLTWEAAFHLLRHFPSLTELHLSLNELNEIRVSPPGAVHSGITDLYINSAAIDNTSNTLCHLGIAFPQLENLVLIGNPFQQFASECSILQESFPKLKSLNISETGLCQWEEVEKLRHLPALTSLRITGLEFMEGMDEKVRRQLLIGYLPNITRLNGSPVDEVKREDAERAFIRHFMDLPQKPPRYYELEEIHGKLDPLVEIDFGNHDRFVTVTVHYEGRSTLGTVDLSMSLTDAKKQMAHEVGLNPNQFHLFHLDKTMNFGLDRMIHPNRSLRSYGVKEGNEIHIVPKM